MRINYYEETDSLYISLSERPGADVVFVSEGVTVDVDESGEPVGIDIDSGASRLADIETLTSDGIERVVALGRGRRDKAVHAEVSDRG